MMARSAPPFSNTGGKSSPHLNQSAHVDALAFSFKNELFNDSDLQAFCHTMAQFFHGFNARRRRGGALGFLNSADVAIGGVIAWGGNTQGDRVYVSLMGGACSLCHDWPGLQAWLEYHQCRISRIDLAHDDLRGERYSVERAVTDYGLGGFTTGGHPPSTKYIASAEAGQREAQTFYVGKSQNGKMLRVYDKGQQLGDTQFPDWVRVELQLTAKDRVIPYDTLTRPQHYLAGAYPALEWISAIKEVISTARRIVERTLDQLMEWAHSQVGRVLYAAAIANHGDIFSVFDRLKRSELPRRLAGAFHHLQPIES
jgi:phage replication initiation protein